MLLIALLLLITPFAPGEIAFRIADPDLIPEGIAYDASTKTFFVGSTFQRKIVAVDAAGRVRDFTTEGQDGLFGVLGLRVDPSRRVLWAISSNAGGTMQARGLDKSCLGCSTVTSYSIESGALLEKYVLGNKPAVHFLNDLAIAPNGDVFLTDTMSGGCLPHRPRKQSARAVRKPGREYLSQRDRHLHGRPDAVRRNRSRSADRQDRRPPRGRGEGDAR